MSDPWPTGVPLQTHGMDPDPFFVEEGDLDAARALVESTDRIGQTDVAERGATGRTTVRSVRPADTPPPTDAEVGTVAPKVCFRP